MTLRCCLFCKKLLLSSPKPPPQLRLRQCPECTHPIRFDLGREEASLSGKKVNEVSSAAVQTLDVRYKTMGSPLVDQEILDCEEALLHKPDNQGALLHLAKLYHSRGDYTKSLTYFLKLIEVNPHDESAHRTVSEIYLKEAHYEKALESLHNMDVLFGGSFYIWFNIGVTYTAQGESTKAVNAFKKAESLAKTEGDRMAISRIKDAF